MKKIIMTLAALALVIFALTSCGGGAGSPSSPSGENHGTPSIVQLQPSHFVAQTNTSITLHAKVLDGNGAPVVNTLVTFTNLSPIGVLSSTTAKTNNTGIATVSLKSTTAGFSTVQAEVNKGVSAVRDTKTVFFSISGAAPTATLTLHVDDGDGVPDQNADFTLFKTPTDDQRTITAVVLNVDGRPAPALLVTFGSDSTEATFPLGNTAITDINGQASVLLKVVPSTLRSLPTVINITALASNGAFNMVSLTIEPVTISKVSVSATPTIVEPDGTSTITAAVTLTTGGPAPDGTTVNFTATCGSITPFAQTTLGAATATFTAPSTTGTCAISASAGGITSNTVSITVTTALSVQPSAQTISGITGGTATFRIFGGVAPYTVASSNPSIAFDSAPGDGIWNVSSSGSFVVSVPASTPPNAVTLTIRDSAGTTVTATLTISVPTTTLTITPSTFSIGNTVTPPVDVQYFVSGGVAPYTVHYTLLNFVDQTVTPDGAVIGTSGTNQGLFTVRFINFTGATATFQIIVVDSLGASVTSTVNITESTTP